MDSEILFRMVDRAKNDEELKSLLARYGGVARCRLPRYSTEARCSAMAATGFLLD